jgi:GAF domain-containing protein
VVERDRWLAQTLLAMTDTVGEEFELDRFLTDFVSRIPSLVEGAEAAVILVEEERPARWTVAARRPFLRDLQEMEVGQGRGPAIDVCRSGVPLVNREPGELAGCWPGLIPLVWAAGFRSVHVLALRHRGLPVGALTVYCPGDRRLSEEEVEAAQSIADAAAIGIVQARTLAKSRELANQLQGALYSRVAIEQAKGVLAERLAVPVEDAFTLMRRHARNNRRRLDAVAKAVVHGTMTATELEVAS